MAVHLLKKKSLDLSLSFFFFFPPQKWGKNEDWTKILNFLYLVCPVFGDVCNIQMYTKAKKPKIQY